MPPEEVRELLELKDWSTAKLAGELDVTENTVFAWLSGRRKAGGPARILMRQWLAEARRETKRAVAK
jgi:DNA-binding transcriptional regulator YiaG